MPNEFFRYIIIHIWLYVYVRKYSNVSTAIHLSNQSAYDFILPNPKRTRITAQIVNHCKKKTEGKGRQNSVSTPKEFTTSLLNFRITLNAHIETFFFFLQLYLFCMWSVSFSTIALRLDYSRYVNKNSRRFVQQCSN